MARINKVIENHMLWLKDHYKGKPAVFLDVDLSRIDLSNTDFRYATFRGTKLFYADFQGSNLQHCKFYSTDLRFTNFTSADLRFSTFYNSDLRDSVFLHADIRYTNIQATIGDGKTFRSIQSDGYDIVYSSDVMAIGCKQHFIKDWWEFDDETIDRMSYGALEWWKVWKPILQNIIEVSPATSTGYEEEK